MTQNNIPDPQNDADAPVERGCKRTAPAGGEHLEFATEAEFYRWRNSPDRKNDPEVFLAHVHRPLWSF
jgi:hypothetical protein